MAPNGIVADRQQITQNKEDVTTLKEDLKGFVPKQQGAENKGKALVVGDDGNVTVGEVRGGDGIPIINTMSDMSPLVVPDSAERVNKGFSIIGNTTQNQDPPPSPDNLQEIKNVGKWNEVTQKYEVDIKVTNAKESWDKEQTITITSDRPITKWDKVVEQDGQIGWLYKHKNITLNGGETWKIHSNNMAFYTEFADSNFQNSFCDKYKHKFSAWVEQEYGIYSDNNNAQKYFRPPHEGFEMNVDVWKAFLNNNPLTVICESMSTEFVPLPQSEQDAIRALKTYYPTTVITADGGEVVPTVELTYTADTKNFILNREKVMQTQMLNIQSALISQKISGGGYKGN